MHCPTVRIKDDKAPGGFVVINESDYDEKAHKLYEEPMAKPAPRPATTKESA